MLVLDAHSTEQENAFKLCTNRKYRIWWCSIWNEMRFSELSHHETVGDMKLSCLFTWCVGVCVCTRPDKKVSGHVVKLTKLNLPSGWANPLQSRPHLLRYNYSGGLSTAGRTYHSLFWRPKLLHCIKFNHFHNCISFACQGILKAEDGALSVEYKGWCTCGMWCLLENCSYIVSRLEINFSNSCLMPTSLVKIAWHELRKISGCATTSLMINLQTALSKSCTVAVTSYVFNEGCPEHSSVSVNVRPS